MRSLTFLVVGLAAAAAAPRASAQALPRINGLYPPGARAGSTVEVSIRGGGLDGASEVLVNGPGLKATLNAADVKINPEELKVFQAKCALCHELRGPATISRSTDQWVATVDRMINSRGAPIQAADRAKIVSYLQASARASAGLTAKLTIAPDAPPGQRELRIRGTNGTSTAFPFEVTRQPETVEIEPNDQVGKAAAVTLPVVVSGQIGSGDVDCFSFPAKKGERLVFNCSAYRLSEATQAVFFPVLSLRDAAGKEVAKNNGYFGFDPLIDWTAPADGTYTIQVRDMLYRGSPASIYRLTIGNLPYRTYLFPAGGRRGSSAQVALEGENMAPETVAIGLPADGAVGLRQVDTPQGPLPFVVGDAPEVTEGSVPPAPLSLPVSLNGRLAAAGDIDRYSFTVGKESLGTYAFELYAERIGSPLAGRLTLRNARGQEVATNDGGRGFRDARVEYNFTQPGDYTLEVADSLGKGSAAHVYRVQAGPAAPDFLLTAAPDNPNLGPGSSLYLQVNVRRRVGITNDIEVVVKDLPAGVSASRCVIRPEENQGFMILSAAPDAKPGTFSLASVVGRTTAGGKTLERTAQPFEIYRINNNPQNIPRGTMVVSVGPPPMWTVTLEPSSVEILPQGGPVTVKARLQRKGMEGDLPFAIVGLPQGVQAQRALLFRRGTSELSFTLTPQPGNGIFARGASNAPASFSLAIVNGREGEAMQMASPPLQVKVGDPTAKPGAAAARP